MAIRSVGMIAALVLVAGCQSAVVSGVAETSHAVAESRSVGTVVDDAAIYTMINHYYLQTDINDLLPNVNVIVRSGRVLLIGVVKQQETVQKAVDLAWKVSDVKEVINELKVNPQGQGFSRANDEWIEKQVEAKLTVSKGVNVLNYSIEVVDSTVYFLGIAAHAQEIENAAAIASQIKGVRQVVSHLRIAQPRELRTSDPSDAFEKPKYRR